MRSPTLTLLLHSLIVLAWLGIVGACSEFARRRGYNAEVTRKIVHIGAGHVILIAWWLAVPAWLGIAASVFFGAIALLSYRFPLLPGINSIGRQSWGTFFYAMSIGLLMASFWPIQRPEFAVIGILTMTWGDGLAALVGQRYGQHLYQVWGEKKSLEGSLTMLLVSGAICLIFLQTAGMPFSQALWISSVGAVFATALESISKYGIDNLSVPVGTAGICFALSLLSSAN